MPQVGRKRNANAGLADAKARDFVLGVMPELGSGNVDTPPILLMTAAGAVLAAIDNYSTEGEVFKNLLSLLESHPDWNRMSEEETSCLAHGEQPTDESASLDAARIQFELGQDEAAIQALRKLVTGAKQEQGILAAQCELLRMLRLRGDVSAVDELLASLSPVSRSSQPIVLERLRGAVMSKKWTTAKAAVEALGAIAEDQSEWTEVQYLCAIIEANGNKLDEAKHLLETIVSSTRRDRWVYRADWALWTLTKGWQTEFSTFDPRTRLGRIGYMGRLSPEFAAWAPNFTPVNEDQKGD